MPDFNRLPAATRKRYATVLAYIDAHLETALDIDRLADVACVSKFHFQRQFSALFGLSVGAYIVRLRLRRAAWQLAFRPQVRIGDIAAQAGYENAESFARAFRQHSGLSPSEFRQTPDFSSDALRDISLSSPTTDPAIVMKNLHGSYALQIVDFPATTIAALEHRGAPETLMRSVQQFISWRKAQGLSPARSATWNIVYDDPATTPAGEYRFDIGATLLPDVVACDRDGQLPANAQGVIVKQLPAGRCAVLRLQGGDEGLRAAFDWLYGEWLPASGEELRDFPAFMQRVKFFPDVPAHEAVTDIYLPLK